MADGTLQQRVERMEADRQGKAKRVGQHALFSQQLPAPEGADLGTATVQPKQPPAAPPGKVVRPDEMMSGLFQVLARHYVQQLKARTKTPAKKAASG